MDRDAASVRLKHSSLKVHLLKLQVADNVAIRQERDAANVRLKESNVEVQLLKKERDAAILRLGKMAECGERMDLFAAAEEKLVSRFLDIYQADVFLRLAKSVAAGCLDRTMDVYMLVALAHNAPLSPSDKRRRCHQLT